MYVIIDELTGVHVFNNFTQARKHTNFEKHEYTCYGKDYVLNTTGDTLEISRDIRQLERVASERVFSKRSMGLTEIGVMAAAVFSFIAFMKMGSIPEEMVTLLKTMSQVSGK